LLERDGAVLRLAAVYAHHLALSPLPQVNSHNAPGFGQHQQRRAIGRHGNTIRPVAIAQAAGIQR